MISNETLPSFNVTSPFPSYDSSSFQPSWGLVSLLLPLASTFIPRGGAQRQRRRGSSPQSVGSFGHSLSSLLPVISCWYLIRRVISWPFRAVADMFFLTAYLRENTPAFSWVTLYLTDAASQIRISKHLRAQVVEDTSLKPAPLTPFEKAVALQGRRKGIRSTLKDEGANAGVDAARQHSYRIISHPSQYTLVAFEGYLLVVCITRMVNHSLVASSRQAIAHINGQPGQQPQPTKGFGSGKRNFLKIRFIPLPSFLLRVLPISQPAVPPPPPSATDEHLALASFRPSVARVPSRSILLHLVSSSKIRYATQSPTSVRVHTFGGICNNGTCTHPQCQKWTGKATRSKRRIESVVLPAGKAEWLKKDLQEFIDNKEYYYERGIPHRRGVLLSGEAGSGKTSLVTAISSELNLDIYTLDLSSSTLTDLILQQALSLTPPSCIILIEDIDVAFAPRAFDHNPTASRVGVPTSPAPSFARPVGLTMSGVLNALDGLGSVDGRILFATTNYYSRLDSALTRPGRMDVHLRFGLAAPEQVQRLFELFMLPTEKERSRRMEAHASSMEELERETEKILELAKEFARVIPGEVFSAATIQGYLLEYKDSPREACENAAAWSSTQLSIAQAQHEEIEREWEARVRAKAREERKTFKAQQALLARLDGSDLSEDDIYLPAPMGAAALGFRGMFGGGGGMGRGVSRRGM